MHYYKVAPLLLCVGPLDPCMTRVWTRTSVKKLQSLRGTLTTTTMTPPTTNQDACPEDYYHDEVALTLPERIGEDDTDPCSSLTLTH